jgi:hypothetical protein
MTSMCACGGGEEMPWSARKKGLVWVTEGLEVHGGVQQEGFVCCTMPTWTKSLGHSAVSSASAAAQQVC